MNEIVSYALGRSGNAGDARMRAALLTVDARQFMWNAVHTARIMRFPALNVDRIR